MKKTREAMFCCEKLVSEITRDAPGKTYVAVVAVQVKLLSHAGDGGVGQVGTVHEGNAVHDADGDDQATVDVADDLALFGVRESMVGRVGLITNVGGGRPADLLTDMVKLLLFEVTVGGGHGDGEIKMLEGGWYD